MKWGETQNLLSVIIGLNIAYYAFKEMREPHLEKIYSQIDKLGQDITKQTDDVSLARRKIPNSQVIWNALFALKEEWLKLRLLANGIVIGASSRKFENMIGIPAMIVAVATTILLVISTAKFDDSFSLWFFYPLVVIGFAPVVSAVAANYLILWAADQQLQTEYDRLWNLLHLDIGGALAGHTMAIAEARYERDRGKLVQSEPS